MPNIVRNVIMLEEDDAPKILEEIKGTGCRIDFNKIIPAPEWLFYDCNVKMNESLSVYKYLLGQPMGNWCRTLLDIYLREGEDNHACLNRLNEMGIIDLRLGAKAYDCQQEHGSLDLFSWKNINWDSSEPMVSDVKNGNILIFNTAWTAPFKVVEALARKFPDVSFTYKWADEEDSNCGEKEYENGELVSEYYADEKSREAKEISDECWKYRY